jgi:hypothetical protein
MKMSKPMGVPRAPVSPFVRAAAARWAPGSFAHHPPAEPTAGVKIGHPHGRAPTGKGARSPLEGA